jgi:predicted metalloprotease with PDZ domain
MTLVRGSSCLVVALAGATLAALLAQSAYAADMTLTVDETQAARRVAFVREELQVRPGDLALAYPKWIPGEHGPTGPVQELAAIRIRTGETTLPWVRDPDDINTIHVQVPQGADRITVDFDSLLQNTISDHQILLAWNTTVLYPRDADKTRYTIEPSIVLPPNWKFGTGLKMTAQNGPRVSFAPVSLERLIDTPVLAGEFFKAVPLPSHWPAELDITGDSPSAVDDADKASAFALFGKLVDQDEAMFEFRHWQTLHLLVSQSEARPFDGLEHGDSPYCGTGDAGLSKKENLERFGWPLFAHEQSHSWDGKYRRPGELYSRQDYQGPERTTLLWVYEGLNQYIGMLLATRAGFDDADYMRDYMARVAASFSLQAARATTPLVDTATENWVLRTAFKGGWNSLRRSQDYYDEGALIWLEADTIIRKQSNDGKSLDDFLRSFFGQRDTGPIVAPYTREDVEAALSAICPYDWHAFFEKRVYEVNPKPPVEGLEAAGWRLVYSATPNNEPFWGDLASIGYYGDYSIGLTAMKDGSIIDVLSGSPAYDAGLGPHMTVIAVDGHAYAADVLNQAIAHPKDGKISVLVRNFDSVEAHEIRYEGGVRYPHLERIPGTQDYLSEILTARTLASH